MICRPDSESISGCFEKIEGRYGEKTLKYNAEQNTCVYPLEKIDECIIFLPFVGNSSRNKIFSIPISELKRDNFYPW
jgi:hypothetical protein